MLAEEHHRAVGDFVERQAVARALDPTAAIRLLPGDAVHAVRERAGRNRELHLRIGHVGRPGDVAERLAVDQKAERMRVGRPRLVGARVERGVRAAPPLRIAQFARHAEVEPRGMLSRAARITALQVLGVSVRQVQRVVAARRGMLSRAARITALQVLGVSVRQVQRVVAARLGDERGVRAAVSVITHLPRAADLERVNRKVAACRVRAAERDGVRTGGEERARDVDDARAPRREMLLRDAVAVDRPCRP